MASVAEYLGQDVRSPVPIAPVALRGGATCPFMNAPCTKVAQGAQPVCSVRDGNGELWIVCRNRLCSSKKTHNNMHLALSDYQKDILFSIGEYLYDPPFARNDVTVKREARIPVVGAQAYSADYVMQLNPRVAYRGLRNFVLEMQGGGETSNTGQLTEHVRDWAADNTRTNAKLSTSVPSVGTLETNAWRRQQEQFIVKGNVSILSGGGMAFAVGRRFYDYLHLRFGAVIPAHTPGAAKPKGWNLALITFDEVVAGAGIKPAGSSSLDLKIDNTRILYTDYRSFVSVLTNQGAANASLFTGVNTNI